MIRISEFGPTRVNRASVVSSVNGLQFGRGAACRARSTRGRGKQRPYRHFMLDATPATAKAASLTRQESERRDEERRDEERRLSRSASESGSATGSDALTRWVSFGAGAAPCPPQAPGTGASQVFRQRSSGKRARSMLADRQFVARFPEDMNGPIMWHAPAPDTQPTIVKLGFSKLLPLKPSRPGSLPRHFRLQTRTHPPQQMRWPGANASAWDKSSGRTVPNAI